MSISSLTSLIGIVCLALAGRNLGSGIGAVLAFCAGLLIVFSFRQEKKPSCAHLFFAGFVFHFIAFGWAQETFFRFSGGFKFLSYAFLGVVCLYSALQFVLFGYLAKRLIEKSVCSSMLAIPLAWTSAEVLFPGIMPWKLAQPFIAVPVFNQAADIFGISFLSFAVLCICEGILSLKNGLKKEVLGSACFLVLILLYGLYRQENIKSLMQTAEGISVGLVQSNLDPKKDFVKEKTSETLLKQQELSKPLIEQGADILVWPESAVHFDILENEKQLPASAGLHPLSRNSVPLIFGGQTKGEKRAKGTEFYVSAFSLASDGVITSRYDKQRLFPFAEEAPLWGLLPSLNDVRGGKMFVRPGQNQRALSLSVAGKEISVPVVVCYEDIFASLFWQLVEPGKPGFLLTLSNDTWFEKTAARGQHFWLSVWQAVIFRKFLVRATNDGMTAVVSPLGEVQQSIPEYEEGVLLARDVKLLDLNSPYQLWGDWPMIFLSLAALGVGIASSLFGKR